MKEKPILFKGEMVRAILEGRKTQTRRACKTGFDKNLGEFAAVGDCPYGQPGDRLWVKETFQCVRESKKDGQRRITQPLEHYVKSGFAWIEYAATPKDEHTPPRWRPSIFMPRFASRITLEIVSVRVERLKEISETDAEAEGVQYRVVPAGNGMVSPLFPLSDKIRMKHYPHPRRDKITHGAMMRAEYASVWDEINGAGSWEKNPWVWVIGFKKL